MGETGERGRERRTGTGARPMGRSESGRGPSPTLSGIRPASAVAPQAMLGDQRDHWSASAAGPRVTAATSAYTSKTIGGVTTATTAIADGRMKAAMKVLEKEGMQSDTVEIHGRIATEAGAIRRTQVKMTGIASSSTFHPYKGMPLPGAVTMAMPGRASRDGHSGMTIATATTETQTLPPTHTAFQRSAEESGRKDPA